MKTKKSISKKTKPITKLKVTKTNIENNLSINFEIDKVVKEIKQLNPKFKPLRVCVQLPDGLKEFSKQISDKIEKNTNSVVLIWIGSNFGGCDLPLELDSKVDLLVHFGHSVFIR